MPLSVLVSIVFGVVLVALAWVPTLRPFAVLPAAALLCSLMWAFRDIEVRMQQAARKQFLGGRCVRCGYDLRTGPERCPECGSTVWTPTMPLARPGKLWPGTRSTLLVPEREILQWMLERRDPTGDNSWDKAARSRAIGSMVIRICQRTSDAEPFGRFLPCDPFELVSSSTSVDDFAKALQAELEICVPHEDLAVYERLSVGDVVDDLARRSSIFPRMTWRQPCGNTHFVQRVLPLASNPNSQNRDEN